MQRIRELMLDGQAFSEAVTNAFKPFPDENHVGLRHVRNRDCLRFIRLKNARGFAPGFSEASVRCPMVLADGFPKGVYSSRLEKRSQALLTTQVRQGISRLRCANRASGP
jgi:hypothetical protein